MNEVKTIKTKSFYAYKSEEDLNLEALHLTPSKVSNKARKNRGKRRN
jgi:hypothetical protein